MSFEHPSDTDKQGKRPDKKVAVRPKAPELTRKETAVHQRTLELEAIRENVKRMMAAQGMPMDERVIEKRAVLNALQFPTSLPHEDHLKRKDEEVSMDLQIVVHPVEPQQLNWKEEEQLQDEMRQAGEELRVKLLKLIDEYYHGRRFFPDARLGLRPDEYGYSLESKGLALLPQLTTSEEKSNRSALYQKELDDFITFLRMKFLSLPE